MGLIAAAAAARVENTAVAAAGNAGRAVGVLGRFTQPSRCKLLTCGRPLARSRPVYPLTRGTMGGALSRASRAVRAGPPPSEFPAPPRVPKRAAPAAVSEMEQARSIEATLNQATISSSTVISHGAAPTGMAQRNALVGELDPLEL